MEELNSDMREIMTDVQLMIQDTEQTNSLSDGQEQVTVESFKAALRKVISDFNSTPPMSDDTWQSIPRGLLIDGLCFVLLMMEANRQLRNNVEYSGQNMTINFDGKSGQYADLAMMYKNDFLTKLKDFKVSRNIDSAWGGSSSGYAYISTWGRY